MLCALMYRKNGDLANLLKSARKKSAPECPFESLFGQCPSRGDIDCISCYIFRLNVKKLKVDGRIDATVL